ncbi:hypothetical protein CM240_3163 [Clostridium bornimense]|uniref:Uncharacterized protein n=2 Tax=Clostridium bornimense TaxID=1216932 RepID=W6SKB4_9CLOT|nr:hypothetical protein CM240_3163 [Clostridium bornimense]
MFHSRYNTIEDYLSQIALSNGEIRKLKNKLISYIKGGIL